MRAAHASEMHELTAWIAAVRPLPRFLRTKDARALLDALEPLDLLTDDGTATSTFDAIAAQLGRSRDELLAALRRCPFGVSL